MQLLNSTYACRHLEYLEGPSREQLTWHQFVTASSSPLRSKIPIFRFGPGFGSLSTRISTGRKRPNQRGEAGRLDLGCAAIFIMAVESVDHRELAGLNEDEKLLVGLLDGVVT